MKHLIPLLLLALLMPATATAYNFKVDGIYYNINGNEASVTFSPSSNQYSGDVTIPATVTYNGTTYSVTSISGYAFYECSGLTSINIPNSVTSIGDYAFRSCFGLISITVDSNNPMYDSRDNCNAIIESASNTLIAGCINTIIPNSITSIGHDVFNGLTGLTSINIPNSVTTIGSQAFSGCIDLTSINIPNSVTSIGEGAFSLCIGLTSIHIPSSVTSIGDIAFHGCGLTNITVDNNNPIYDSRDNCNAIIETSSNTLITGCMNTVISNSVKLIGDDAFSGCTGLTNINIPNSVTSIGNYAFCNCTRLTSINIPNSVTHIGDLAFCECNIPTSIYIPISVTYIGDAAFSGCSGLDTVYSYISNPSLVTIGYDVFELYPENYTTRILYVPCGTSGAYRAIDNWSRYFGNIIEMEPEVPVSLIKLDMTVASMALGETLQLTATIMPEDATCKTVKWMSSDTNVAIVDENGQVTALAPGPATITATTTDGTNLSESCAITVEFGIIENYLTINNITVRHGETVVIPVAMTNEASITSFQTDIFLPEGIELLQEDGEYLIDPSSRMTRTHSIISEATDNDAIHVLCYSPSNKAFTGNSGEGLFYMTVKVADDAEGDYTIALRNTRLTTTDSEELLAPDAEANVKVKANEPGDVKEDGMINVADVSALIQYLLTGNSSLINLDNADVNGDGLVIINDIAALINMLLAPGR